MAEASTVLSAQEKYDLIARNLEEVVGEDEIKKVLAERSLKGIFWQKKNFFFEKIVNFNLKNDFQQALRKFTQNYVNLRNIKKNMSNLTIFWKNVQFDNFKKKA